MVYSHSGLWHSDLPNVRKKRLKLNSFRFIQQRSSLKIDLRAFAPIGQSWECSAPQSRCAALTVPGQFQHGLDPVRPAAASSTRKSYPSQWPSKKESNFIFNPVREQGNFPPIDELGRGLNFHFVVRYDH
jgi:hypothetical protein